MSVGLHFPAGTQPPGEGGQRGLAMIVVLGTTMIVTTICVALVGVMNTDMLHASIQTAIARSFPAWTLANTDCSGSNIISICPAMTSVTAGALPL